MGRKDAKMNQSLLCGVPNIKYQPNNNFFFFLLPLPKLERGELRPVTNNPLTRCAHTRVCHGVCLVCKCVEHARAHGLPHLAQPGQASLTLAYCGELIQDLFTTQEFYRNHGETSHELVYFHIRNTKNRKKNSRTPKGVLTGSALQNYFTSEAKGVFDFLS